MTTKPQSIGLAQLAENLNSLIENHVGYGVTEADVVNLRDEVVALVSQAKEAYPEDGGDPLYVEVTAQRLTDPPEGVSR